MLTTYPAPLLNHWASDPSNEEQDIVLISGSVVAVTYLWLWALAYVCDLGFHLIYPFVRWYPVLAVTLATASINCSSEQRDQC